MAKTSPKTRQTQIPRPAKVHKERLNFYVDLETVEILDDLVTDTPEIENRSAALRYLARLYKQSGSAS
jgi:hypothetical protein